MLVGANMSGSEKMFLFAIGKSLKPRAFNNLKKPPIKYSANKKAWTQSNLFEAEMMEFDRRVKKEGRKVAS